jgi:hypothetical protein
MVEPGSDGVPWLEGGIALQAADIERRPFLKRAHGDLRLRRIRYPMGGQAMLHEEIHDFGQRRGHAAAGVVD